MSRLGLEWANQFAMLTILAVGLSSQLANAGHQGASSYFSAQVSAQSVGKMADALDAALTDIDFGTAISDFSFIGSQLRQLPADIEPLQKNVENIIAGTGDLDPKQVRDSLNLGLKLAKKHYIASRF